MKHLLFLSFLFSFALVSCQPKSVPISYNNDECAFCKMKISDARFGAEIVTKKGKIYKYDSAECLVHTYVKNENPDYAFVLVTDYASPHSLIDAANASFLISENQPSPMGGNLSAYEFPKDANNAQKEKGGKLLTFEELQDEYRKKNQ